MKNKIDTDLPAPFYFEIQSESNWYRLPLREYFAFRDLLYFLIWKDIKIRYKQSVLGVTWTVFQPLATMTVLTFVFHRMTSVKIPNESYPVFVLCGIVLWNYFFDAVSNSTSSLIQNRNLITKVYFPRILIPISILGRCLFDFLIVLAVLSGVLIYNHTPLSWAILTFPIFLMLVFLTTLGTSLHVSALSVRFRDIPHVMPFLLQVLFWLTPVAYGTNNIPDSVVDWYSLNPLYGAIEGWRWALIGTPLPSWTTLILSGILSLLLCGSGIVLFNKAESQFADWV